MVTVVTGRWSIAVEEDGMSKEEQDLFLQEMQGVAQLKPSNTVTIQPPKELTPGHLERRSAAMREFFKDQNNLTTQPVEILKSNDVLTFKRTGIQNGVFRKLRLGQYDIEARLDLHRKTVEEARKEVFQFIRDCCKFELRSVIILHGKGDRNANQEALLKSYVAAWLPELPEVLAFHSAQKHHGGTGAVYVMLRKSERAKQENRERHGLRGI